jgi:hypothetical protein
MHCRLEHGGFVKLSWSRHGRPFMSIAVYPEIASALINFIAFDLKSAQYRSRPTCDREEVV